MQDASSETTKEMALAVNQEIDGVVCLGGTKAKVYENGRFAEGILAVDQKVDDLDLAAYFFLRRHPDGSLARVMLKRPQLVGALVCVGGLEFYPGGRPKYATLGEGHLIQGMPIAAADLEGYKLSAEVDLTTDSRTDEFREEYGERWMHLEGIIEVAGRSIARDYWKARTVEYFDGGQVKFAELGGEFKSDGSVFKAGTRLEFDEGGHITSTW